MVRLRVNLSLAGLLLAIPFLLTGLAQAVEVYNGTSYIYNISEPTTVDNWTEGWGATSLTGWDYVGQVNGASGVYLGDGWVLTAGHVGSGTFILDGNTYETTGVSYNISDGNVDLTLFQIVTTSALPTVDLTLSLSAPTAYSSSVVIIGYGGGSESWGVNTVTSTGVSTQVDNYNYTTTDFVTAFGTHTYRFFRENITLTNNAELVSGDSGGAAFIYNATTGMWELAGINEAVDPDTGDSYIVQLSSYIAEIEADMAASAVPEPATWAMLGSGLLLLAGLFRHSGRARD